MDNSLIKQREAQGLICVTLDVHLWSGRKRLRKEKLLEKNPEFKNLPPESLTTLGSIKIADPDDLAPFMRIKREAEKQLLINGLPLLGTIGIPEAKLDSVFKKLTVLQKEFEGLRAQLHRDYETRVQDWREKDENKGPPDQRYSDPGVCCRASGLRLPPVPGVGTECGRRKPDQ